MESKILNDLLEQGLVAIVRGVKSSSILPTVDALYNGGITAVEITVNQHSQETIEETLESIRLVHEKYQEKILIGAGTVLTVEQVDAVVASGAQFILSPNVNVEVIQKTKKKGCISIPGAITPSEIVTAYQGGADLIKLFPASDFGVSYIKAIMGPLGHIPYIAVGGITPDNMKDFMKIGVCGFGIGNNLVNLQYVNEGKFEEIEKTARIYYDNIQILKRW